MIGPINEGERFQLTTPTKLPNASGFLWNKQMMIHMNCRGYAVAQFMQPEPAKYAHAPNLEAKTFMQPEQAYYAHHPGRFCYIKDESNGSLFSVPYEPVRASLDKYQFSVGKHNLVWRVEKDGIAIEMRLSLATNEALELWSIQVKNLTNKTKHLSIYPYFPVGYMSWMNQSGEFNKDLCSIICSAVTPYQKYKEYDKIKTLKDKTFLMGATMPDAWEVNQSKFEGEGGLHNPSAISKNYLAMGNALYETPACAMQYKARMEAKSSKDYHFVFGPAQTEEDIKEIRNRYFGKSDANTHTGFETALTDYKNYIEAGQGVLQIKTPDATFDNFINHWLPRQMYYHGETNRLSTDPQTRNYLQDNMGMSYIKPSIMRTAFITALNQQETSGAMPDGILIQKEATLKYINQVPHSDHCVWLPICLKAYLDETNDYDLLNEIVGFSKGNTLASIEEHMHLAMDWLFQNRDERGLSYIDQGDWCDPMNMVGPKGKGVSGWLSLATAYALQVWAQICETVQNKVKANAYRDASKEINAAVNKHLWDGNWYARGITDANVTFGVKSDLEGRIFLNPQAWALLSGAADSIKGSIIEKAVSSQLETPYGVEMLAPSFTKMREDIGRVTQKHPGSAENGSVYNHAAAFYVFGLYKTERKEKAFELLRKMIPGPDEDDIIQRGQLPVFIPNYYRGAYKQLPRTAGRSSQLFNTGTVPWVYRCLIEGLFGLQGNSEGLLLRPQLPKTWQYAQITRHFRGAMFNINIERVTGVAKTEITVNEQTLNQPLIKNISAGSTYQVAIKLPK